MLFCGLYELDITPALGMEMPGHFVLRRAKGILERLYAYAAYFENDAGQKVVLVTCDVIGIPDELALKTRAEIARDLDMPASAVLLCATHTHYGGPVETWDDFVHEDPVYVDFLGSRMHDAAVYAVQNKRPVRIGYGSGIERTLAHYRDFVLPDGSYRTNAHVPGMRAFGEIDPEVGVLRIDNADGSPYGLIANYACHCDSVGGVSLYSSDYPGAMRDMLRKTYGAEFMPLFVNGFCGNINHIDFEHGTSAEPGYYRRMGRILAGAVSEVYEKIFLSDDDAIGGADDRFTLPSRLPDAETLAWADTVRPEDGVIDNFYASEARRMDAEGSQPIPVTVQVLKIGALMIYGMPGEIYVEFAKILKDRSPSAYTMTANLANGNIGYVGIRELFRKGIYSTRICCSAQTEPDAGYEMSERLLKLAAAL